MTCGAGHLRPFARFCAAWWTASATCCGCLMRGSNTSDTPVFVVMSACTSPVGCVSTTCLQQSPHGSAKLDPCMPAQHNRSLCSGQYINIIMHGICSCHQLVQSMYLAEDERQLRTELAGAAADGAATGAATATVVMGAGLALVVLKIAARPPKRPPLPTRPKIELEGVPLVLLADEEPPPLVLVTEPVHMPKTYYSYMWYSFYIARHAVGHSAQVSKNHR